jgi:Ca-activated chloride channel family protein
MISLGDVALLRPLWLFVPPALLLLLRLTRRRDGALGDWTRAVDAPLLAALLRRQGVEPTAPRGSPVLWCVALLSLALSGPAIKTRQPTQFRNLDTALVLLDASRGERLPQAAAAAQLIFANGGARQMGLVVFAGDAYLASPLTDDVAALETLLFAVDDQTVPDGGARPDRALAFARRVLRESGALASDVVLVSGGEGVDGRTHAQASALADEGHELHTLFVSPRGDAGDVDAGRRAAMATLAREGRGRTGEAARVDDVVAELGARSAAGVEAGARRALEWRDYGRLLLFLAVLPLLLLLRAEGS